MDFEAMVKKARKKNASFDKIDRKSGFATPSDKGRRSTMATARTAIEAAIRTCDWDIVAEAYVLLEEK